MDLNVSMNEMEEKIMNKKVTRSFVKRVFGINLLDIFNNYELLLIYCV